MTRLENHHSIVGINVKSNALWRDLPQSIRDAVQNGTLTEREVEEWANIATEGAQMAFWETIAPDLAKTHGFDDIEQHGRSGGWLVPITGTASPRSLTEDEITLDSVDCPDCMEMTGEADPECLGDCHGSGAIYNPWKARFKALADDLEAAVTDAEQRVNESLEERFADFQTGKCANCGNEHGAAHVCLLGAVAGAVEDRGTTPGGRLVTPQMLANIDADAFSEHIGPVIDWLETQIRDERTRVIYCADHEHYPEEGLVTVDGEELPLVVDNTGTATGFWADGVKGVAVEHEEEANATDDVMCREHPDSQCEWRDS